MTAYITPHTVVCVL